MTNEELIENNAEFIKAHSNVVVLTLAALPSITNELYNFLYYAVESSGFWTNGIVIKVLVDGGALSVIRFKYKQNILATEDI